MIIYNKIYEYIILNTADKKVNEPNVHFLFYGITPDKDNQDVAILYRVAKLYNNQVKSSQVKIFIYSR